MAAEGTGSTGIEAACVVVAIDGNCRWWSRCDGAGAGEGEPDRLILAPAVERGAVLVVAGRLSGGAVLTLRCRSTAAGRLTPVGLGAAGGGTAEVETEPRLKADVGEVDAVDAFTGAFTGVGTGE